MLNAFDEACAEIQAAYARLGHSRGWQFLASPRATLSPTTRIALITTNPGGSIDRPDHGRESCEQGSAYVVQAWKQGYAPGESPLQRQVRALFSMLAEAQARGLSGDELLNESLAAYFVPFRSPTLKALPRAKESVAFATQLWTRIFAQIDPRLIITIDRFSARGVLDIMAAKHGDPVTQEFPIGWGTYSADVSTFSGGQTVVRFPHFSRFGIFNRKESQAPVQRIIDVIAPAVR